MRLNSMDFVKAFAAGCLGNGAHSGNLRVAVKDGGKIHVLYNYATPIAFINRTYNPANTWVVGTVAPSQHSPTTSKHINRVLREWGMNKSNTEHVTAAHPAVRRDMLDGANTERTNVWLASRFG